MTETGNANTAVSAEMDLASTPAATIAMYALLLVSLIAMGSSTNEWVIVSPFLALVGLHPVLAEHIKIRMGYLGHLVLAIPFAVLYNTHEIASNTFFDLSLAFYVTLYMQLYAIMRLYRPLPDKERLPIVLLCTGMAFAASGPGTNDFLLYGLLLMVFGAGMVLLLRASMRTRSDNPAARRHHRLAMVMVCVCIIIYSMVGNMLVKEYFRDLNRIMLRMVMRAPLGSSAGFSDISKLGDVKNLRYDILGQRIAIRAFAGKAPGYLRGNVFLRYGEGQWLKGGFRPVEQNLRAAATARGEQVPKSQRILRYLVPGRPRPEEFESPELWIYPASSMRAHFFLPLRAASIDTTSNFLYRMVGNVFKSKFQPTTRGYGVIIRGPPVFDAAEQDNQRLPVAGPEQVSRVYLDLPPDRELREELDRVMGIARARTPFVITMDKKAAVRNPAGAVKALERYFGAHYVYRIGIRFDTSKPMVEFLRKKTHGHCELFATAGTLLLRRLGIPARYVTGFVCKEKNPYSDLWLARYKHAHAWVEYFDPDAGWTTAEFTPAGGLPQTAPASGAEAFIEYLRALWERSVGFFLREGFTGFLAVLGRLGYWLIENWTRRIITGLVIALFFLWRFGKNRSRRRRRMRPPRNFPAEIARQREEYLQLEKELRKKGLGRKEDETLFEYAGRLLETDLQERESISRFVMEFARRRYAPFE